MTEVGCFVEGCDFVFDVDDPAWGEGYEQHVRWIHVATGDFGPRPVASLFALLAYEIIREDEFVRLAGNALVPAPPPRLGVGYALIGLCVATVGLLASIALLAWRARLVALDRLVVTGLVAIVALALLSTVLSFDLAFRRLARAVVPASTIVRVERYPDTEDDEDDSGGDR